MEGVGAQSLAAQLGKILHEAVAHALVVFDRGVEQRIGRLPAPLPGVGRRHGPLALAVDLQAEGIGADALHAHLGIGGAI